MAPRAASPQGNWYRGLGISAGGRGHLTCFAGLDTDRLET